MGKGYSTSREKEDEDALRAAALFPAENPSPVMRVAADGTLLFANRAADELLNRYVPHPSPVRTCTRVGGAVPRDVQEAVAASLAQKKRRKLNVRCADRHYCFDLIPIAERGYANLYGHDVTDREQAVKKLRDSEERYRSLFNSMTEGFALHEIITDDAGRPCDYRFIDANPAFERLTGLKRDDILGRRVREVLPDIEPYWIEKYGKVALTGEPTYLEERSAPLQRWYGAYAYRTGSRRFAVLFSDITDRKKRDDELTAAHRLLESVADSTHVMMACLDAEFNFLWVNRAYAEAGRRRPQDFIGKNHFDLYPHEQNMAIFRRVVETGEPFEIQSKPFEHPDQPERGTTYWDWALVPAKNSAGKVERLLFTLTDVTEAERAKRELKDSEAQLTAIVENAPFVMMVVDADRRVRRINASGAEFLGRPAESLTGLRGGEALRCVNALDDPRGCGYGTSCRQCPVRQRVLDTIETNRSHDRVEVNMTFQRDGAHEERTFFLYTTPLEISGERRVLVALEDLTDRKRAEEELRKLNAELEQRVAERTAEVKHRSEQLRRLALELASAEDRERRRLARVLHDDLQQTLAYAKLRAEMLCTNADKETEACRAAHELTDCLGQAIDTTRTLSQSLHPPVLHTAGLGPALEQLATATARQYGLKVQTDLCDKVAHIGEDVRGFAYRATRELLFNVVKHAGAKQARLSLSHEPDLLRIAIEDDGVGFDPADLRNRPVEDRGLGLFSIEERAALLGGALNIESAPGRGARFELTLPVAETPPEAPDRASGSAAQTARDDAGRPSTAAGTDRIRVLLVDDHAVIRQGLTSLLRAQTDMEVVGEAADGHRAVETVRQLQPDVVLMDVSMPDMSGIEATRLIKKQIPEVRILGLSMHEMDTGGTRMLDAGADLYITKDGPVEHLLAAIRRLAGTSASRVEPRRPHG